MSDLNNSNHLYYKGIGGKNYTYSLPKQALPRNQKNDTWKRNVMDTLEDIGVYQVSKNLAFRDYYDMMEGNLVMRHFDETLSVSSTIADFTEKVSGLPSYLKHFDLIGIIVNLISGEYDNQKEKVRIDSVDPFSRSELYREKNTQVRQFSEEYFKLELQRLLVLKGINPEGQEFETDEERQQYAQFLEEEKNKLITPSEIESTLNKSWRATIAEWAEATVESDYIRFDLADLDLEEFVDYLLTGRYFRHYHIGYDYYKPERWSPIQTFISEEQDIVYPQDGEYVGYIHYLPPSSLLERYGHLFSHDTLQKLEGEYLNGSDSNSLSIEQAIRKGFSENHIVPYTGYYRRDLANRVQTATGVPMGMEYRFNDQGEQEGRRSFLYDDNYNNIGIRYAQQLRNDIDVRTDLVQVTEAYFKSWKRMGLLTLENPLTNDPYQVEVEEDLLNDFIKENKIKQTKKVSLQEAKEKKEINTLAWFYVPQVWKGKKINSGNLNFIEDLVFDVEPLPYQIKGNSNLFDVKLPVAGIITTSLAKKIEAYQEEYNLHMNLIRNATEKHIGEFLLFDFNLLAAQYKNEWGENTAELIDNFTQNIRDVGMEFTDMSPQNTKGMNPNASSAQKLSINFIQDMQYHAQQAEMFKALAYEQIGITQQRLGQPDKYSTAEGIRQGVDASYAQTERLYRKFNTAKRKELEVHLSAAQYAVKENKDIVIDYVKPDEGRILKKFTDENFHLRRINIIPINDSAQRKNLEAFRQYMMQNNTANNDLLDFAKIFTTKSFKTLLEYAELSRTKKEREVEAGRQHEQQIVQQKIQADREAQLARDKQELAVVNKKIEGDIRVAEINGLARAADNNADLTVIKEIQKATDDNLRNQREDRKIDLQEREVKRKEVIDESQMQTALKNLNLELEKLKMREKENETKRFTSIINKN